MQSSENEIGFSTGALGKGEFRSALHSLQERGVKAVEISALRREELPLLIASLPDLDLSGFDYVSVHAPSRFDVNDEPTLVRELASLPVICQWIVTHPDTIVNCEAWHSIESRLAIENMDTRKSIGRTAAEMATIFDRLPNAKMCLDLAHCEKVDPTMYEAQELIQRFRSRIVQVHLSEITTASTHHRLTMQGVQATRRVAKLIPAAVPVILESPVEPASIEPEIARARELFHPALADLKKDIDAVLRPPATAARQPGSAEVFLLLLRRTGIQVDDAPKAIAQLPHGGPVGRGQVFLTTRDLYDSLADAERNEIEAYFRNQVERLLVEFPRLLNGRTN
ncbi:MAG: sugar phosphate isomerase/epimerase family protein [Terriglobales bacterium]